MLCIFQQALVNGELSGLCGRTSPEVVHPGLQALLPSVEVHACELPKSRSLQVDVQALALADERATVGGHVQDFLLADLPDGLVDCLDIVRDGGNVLDGSIVGDDHIFHIIIPQTEVDELSKEPGADNLEFTGKDTAGVDVAGG